MNNRSCFDWSFCYHHHQSILVGVGGQKSQNNGLVTGALFFSSPRLTLRAKCRVRLAWFMKKSACYEGNLLSNFRDYFSKNEDIHNYHTRSASMAHTSYGKFFVEYRGAEIWNNLPDNFKNKMTSYSSFKYSVKSSIQMIQAIIPIC